MRYHDLEKAPGSASAKTVYLRRIPKGQELHVLYLVATIYTSAPGDYTTAKFIYLGYELAGVNYYLEGHDVQSASGENPGCVIVKDVDIPEHARPFAYFEATSASQVYEVMINGTLVPINPGKE